MFGSHENVFFQFKSNKNFFFEKKTETMTLIQFDRNDVEIAI